LRPLVALLTVIASPCALAAAPVEKFYTQVRGARVAGVIVDLRDAGVKVSVQLARGFPGADEPFVELAQRAHCSAAITGTFFGIKNRLPVGDLVVDGRTRWIGARGTALVLTWKNEVTFRRLQPGRTEDWGDVETVLAAGPTLVRAGQVAVAPRHEGFSDPGLFGLATRCAVGLRANQRLLLVTVKSPVSLWELAKIMGELGCLEAMNLDGGTSSALWFRGRPLVEPGRRLVNLLTVHEEVPLALRARPASLVAAEQRHALAEARFAEGLRLEAGGNWRGAADALEAAGRFEPSAETALALARVLQRLHAPAETADAHDRAGQLLLEAGQLDEAERALRRALAITPGRFETRRRLVETLRRQGRLQEAEAEERRARLMELALASPLEAVLATMTLVGNRSEAEFRAPRPVAGAGTSVSGTTPGWSLQFVLPTGARLESLAHLLRIRHDLPYTIAIQARQPVGFIALAQADRDYHTGALHHPIRASKRAVGGEPALVSECESSINGRKVVSRCVVLRHRGLVYELALATEPGVASRALRDFDALLRSAKFAD